MRPVLLVIAVVAAMASAGCGDDGTSPDGSVPGARTSTQPRPISAGYCLVGAGVKPVMSASELTGAAGGAVRPVASSKTGVGKVTASFKTGGDYLYVVAKAGVRISQSEVLRSPETYEFVGLLKAPGKAAITKAGDCLDGLVGDDR